MIKYSLTNKSEKIVIKIGSSLLINQNRFNLSWLSNFIDDVMFLIKKNSASKTVSIFFLIPPISAMMAWFFLNENLSNVDLYGFFIATVGVYIATRKN